MQRPTEPLGVALAGLGWWGKTIDALLAGSRKLRVVRRVDPMVRQPGVTPRLEEALRDPAVEAVVLCTPHSLHTQQIIEAAHAGKHVFCEKPLSLSRADVLKAIQAINSKNLVLAVGHEKRFEPPIQEVFRLVRSGALGKPLQIEANFSQDKFLSLPADNWRLSAKEAPAGPMTATGIHLLDLAVGLMGPAEHVYARVRQLGSQLTNGDTLGVLAGHKFGGNSLISAVLATPFDGRFAVYGSRGWAEVRDKAHPESPQGWTLTTKLREQDQKVVHYPVAQAVAANLDAFADAVRGGGPYPVPQEQMIANVSALEAVFRSAASGKVEEVAS
jgi:predicted dehydrogenase